MTPEQAAIFRATRQAQAALVALDKAGRAELARAYAEAAADIRRQIETFAGPSDSVVLANLRDLLAQVEGRLQALSATRDALLAEGLDKAAAYGARPFGGEVGSAAALRISETALRAVQAFVGADGLQLSDRLWRIDRAAREAVAGAIERAVIEGQSAQVAARAFLAQGAAVPGDLAAKAAGATAGKLGRAVTSALVTSEDSALFNAVRVFRTEVNRAHGEAYMAGGEDRPDFGGWRFKLSPRHPRHDICDLLATQNLYGLGPGVYPTRAKLPWPAHPNTLSFPERVTKDAITEADRAGKETPLEALARLAQEVRAGVLGKTKNEVFDAGDLKQGMIRARVRDVKARLAGRGA